MGRAGISCFPARLHTVVPEEIQRFVRREDLRRWTIRFTHPIGFRTIGPRGPILYSAERRADLPGVAFRSHGGGYPSRRRGGRTARDGRRADAARMGQGTWVATSSPRGNYPTMRMKFASARIAWAALCGRKIPVSGLLRGKSPGCASRGAKIANGEG